MRGPATTIIRSAGTCSLGLRERRDHPPQEVAADAGAADGDDADLLVLAVAELGSERGAVGELLGVEAGDVAGEGEVLLGPVADPGQVGRRSARGRCRRGCRRRRPGRARAGSARCARSSPRCSRRSGTPRGRRRRPSAASRRSRSATRRASASARGSRAGSSRAPRPRLRSRGRTARSETRSWKTMKLASRISSMRRIAWKQCRSCSADSLSTWCDSLARNALAGWIRSPRASSTAVTGCWASQSISRSGWSLRSSSAIATSRCAWPSPIGEEMYSARFRRDLPRTQRSRRRRGRDEVAQEQVHLDRVARMRAGGPSPRARSAIAACELGQPRARGARPDRVVTAVDHQHWAVDPGEERADVCSSGSRSASCGRDQRLRVRLEAPADGVLAMLGRVRLGEAAARRRTRGSPRSGRPSSGGSTSPSPRTRPAARRTRGSPSVRGVAGGSGSAGAMKTILSTRSR